MARAHRHFTPGQVWHLTHRSHKREFLLKSARDRERWLQWLYKTRRRYGLTVLNYCVTANHCHLLRCTVYIDLNMVRAGVVAHPREWPQVQRLQ